MARPTVVALAATARKTAPMTYQHLLVATDGPVTTITLNRPEKRNALALDVMLELTAALRAAGASDATGVILAATGPVFSAGHNFGDMKGAALDDARHLFQVCTDMMDTVQSIPQVVIARVHALATAAGCQLVATCDLAVAGASARFATPGVNIGLFCSTPAVAVSRALAPKHTMELLLTGELIGADDAFRMGLVNRVVADEDLDAATAALADRVAAAPLSVIAAGKAAYRRQLGRSLADAYGIATEAMVDGLDRPEAAEGIGAFLEKRPPVWPT